jgi:SAM-dependent methyltransferase
MPERWEHGVALRDLRGRRRVLEVGCGTGSFLRRCAAAGHDCLGIDMNADAVAVARSAGARAEALSLKELSARGDELFDAVCSFQVLEHVPAPRPFLEGLVRLTAPGGLLILCVPNRESFIRHERMPLDMPPHHMTRWSEGTLRRMADLFGLRTVAIRFEPLPREHVPWFVGVQVREVRRARRLSKIYANRLTAALARRLLNAGLRHLVRGHSLYGVFERPRLSG